MFGGLQAETKIYLNPASISIAKEGILAETKDGPIQVKTLRSDGHGFFVYEKDATKLSDVMFCRKCQRWMTRQEYFAHLPCRG